MSIDMGSACFSGGGSKRTPEQNEATYLQKTTRGEVKINVFLGGVEEFGGGWDSQQRLEWLMKVEVLLRKTCPRCDICQEDVYLYMSVQISNVVRWQRNGEDAMFFVIYLYVPAGWSTIIVSEMRLGYLDNPNWDSFLFIFLYFNGSKDPVLGTTRQKPRVAVSPLVPCFTPRRGIPEGHSAIGFVCGLPESPPQDDRENERENLAILVPWNCLMGVWGVGGR